MKYVVFSDVHANYAALKAVLDHANVNYGSAIDYYLFGGDAVGQGPHPNEVCTLLRSVTNFIGIKGDNDIAVIEDDYRDIEDSEVVDTLQWTREALTDENLKFLEKLDVYEGVESDELEILLVHGSPSNLKTGEVYQNITIQDMEAMFKKTEADIIVTCHTHIPFVRQSQGRLLINAGSVGQPRDRDTRACYLFMDTERRKVTFHRVPYNINMTADSINRAGLPESFAERLFHGW